MACYPTGLLRGTAGLLCESPKSVDCLRFHLQLCKQVAVFAVTGASGTSAAQVGLILTYTSTYYIFAQRCLN